eukprot:1956699-Alexandrium_andersonii.AAC.1
MRGDLGPGRGPGHARRDGDGPKYVIPISPRGDPGHAERGPGHQQLRASVLATRWAFPGFE